MKVVYLIQPNFLVFIKYIVHDVKLLQQAVIPVELS